MRVELETTFAWAGRTGTVVQFRHLGDNEFGSHYAIAVLDDKLVRGFLVTLDSMPLVVGPIESLVMNPKTFASQKMEVLNRVAEYFGRLEYEASRRR
jgi:hypothetical protein